MWSSPKQIPKPLDDFESGLLLIEKVWLAGTGSGSKKDNLFPFPFSFTLVPYRLVGQTRRTWTRDRASMLSNNMHEKPFASTLFNI